MSFVLGHMLQHEASCRLCEAGYVPKPVFKTNLLVHKQIYFPRSKKKRIRKKWAKDPKNFSYIPMVWNAPQKLVMKLLETAANVPDLKGENVVIRKR